jgi:histone H3/H4
MIDVKENAIQGRIEELLEQFRKALERKKQYNEVSETAENSDVNKSLIDALQKEAEKIVERLSCEVEELTETKGRKSLEIEDILNKLTDNTNNNQLLDTFLEN